MNAAVQCLSHTTPLTRHFLSDRFKLDLNLRNPLGTGGKLAYAYENVIKELWMSQKPSISPAKLKRAISLFAPQFAGSAQHDSQEFLAFLLDGLHEDLNLVKNPPYVVTPDFTMDKDLCVAGAEAWDAYCRRNNSLVMDSFYGQFKSTCVCPRCNSVSVSYDAFNHVSLEIPEVTTGPQVELVLIRSRTADTAETSPTRYWFQVPRNACWSDLKDSLSRVSGVPVTKLSVCDVYDNEIYEIFDDQKSVSNVQSSDTVVAYEIDPYTHSTIHAIASHMQSPIDKIQVENSKRSFGYPLLLSFNVGLTCGEVWHYIWNQISYVFVDTLDPNVSSQMRIRIVHKDGLPREVFPVAIGVTDSNDIKNVSSTLPRYSNIPLSTYLGSQCTERFLFLHLEWTIESEDEILTQKRFLRTEEHSSVAESMRRKNDRVTLERCFEKFARSERLDQYNLWYCSFCKEHVRAMKTIELWRVPNILIVHFKRFEYFHAFRREKIETLVHFPLESLDMNKFCGPFKANDSFVDNKIPALYDLFGVINHVGRMGFGHYYATCRHFTDTHIEKDWFSFDDSSVEFIETPETNIISSSAYVLFYRRRIFS
jgi:ubiquitin carboxyl-terminal hydrolase 4/11/15